MHFFQATSRTWMGSGAMNKIPIEVAAMSSVPVQEREQQ